MRASQEGSQTRRAERLPSKTRSAGGTGSLEAISIAVGARRQLLVGQRDKTCGCGARGHARVVELRVSSPTAWSLTSSAGAVHPPTQTGTSLHDCSLAGQIHTRRNCSGYAHPFAVIQLNEPPHHFLCVHHCSPPLKHGAPGQIQPASARTDCWPNRKKKILFVLFHVAFLLVLEPPLIPVKGQAVVWWELQGLEQAGTLRKHRVLVTLTSRPSPVS